MRNLICILFLTLGCLAYAGDGVKGNTFLDDCHAQDMVTMQAVNQEVTDALVVKTNVNAIMVSGTPQALLTVLPVDQPQKLCYKTVKVLTTNSSGGMPG